MPEFTILMPCLNEEKTIGLCVHEALDYLRRNKIEGEVLVSDNGSTDNSIRLATEAGARVVRTPVRGYGSALHNGIKAAKGKYVIMADCDYSYDFSKLNRFVAGMRKGYDLVLGNRYQGKMEKGAMPFSHKYIGVPVLSFMASLRYKTPIYDYHCGLRAVNKSVYLKLKCKAVGMEYATEMIGKFAEHKCSIKTVPIDFRKDLRGGRAHLRAIRDGMRHICVMCKGGHK